MRIFIVFYVLLSLMGNTGNIHAEIVDYKNTGENLYNTTMKQDILSIMAGYPGYIRDIKVSDDHVFLIMKSGRKIIYDDKWVKTNDQKLSNPDLQDMMEQVYPLCRVDKLQEGNYDPGRSRVYALLEEVYGKSKNNIEKNLVIVNNGQGSCQFNINNLASESLRVSMKELKNRSAANRQIASSVYPVNGTYNYRLISGTNRLSPHSFGIAVDLARDKRDYWQWTSRENGEKRLKAYPYEIVNVFENNNFIWGGKWGHFDILHFEYRPEIIFKARYFSNKNDSANTWYYGVPDNDKYIKECIDKIDKTLN